MKRFALLISLLISATAICAAQLTEPKVQTKRTYDKPVKITYKPRPKYPDPQICATGSVALRVEFLSTGEIGKIIPVSSLGFGFTESAIDAARLMKFKPAQLNGKPVTVHKVVQFFFTIY